MKLCLFDVDGTLIDTAGAGRSAMAKALESVAGLRDGLREIRLDGKTDYGIVQEALACNSSPALDPESLQELFRQYVPILREELKARRARFRVLPGARALLSLLCGMPEMVLGLATGNIEDGARTKLEVADLNSFFSLGGFGSKSRSRTDVVRTAVRRAQRQRGAFSSLFLIGDTPQDVFHGQAAGARVIAVSSGRYGLRALQDCRPDLAIASLAPPDPILRFMEAN